MEMVEGDMGTPIFAGAMITVKIPFMVFIYHTSYGLIDNKQILFCLSLLPSPYKL
jgi:hypothetical protein